MAFKVRGAAAPKQPTEFELHVSKKTGCVTVRAYHPGGKKYSLLHFQNGTDGDTGSIVIHGRNTGLGFRTDRDGVPAVTIQA